MGVGITDGIFVYAHNCADFSTTGLCGEVHPQSCYFEEEKNGIRNLDVTLPYDPLDRWKRFKVGNIIKAMVPVRVPPKITDNHYASTVQIYRVKASKGGAGGGNSSITPTDFARGPLRLDLQRFAAVPLYAMATYDGGKVISYAEGLLAGLQDNGDNIKVATKTGSGYVKKTDVEYVETVSIPASLAGVETVIDETRLKYQLFEIQSVEQTLDGIVITAVDVFQTLKDNACTYTTKNQITGAAACVSVLQNLVSPDDRFDIVSDSTEAQKGLDIDRINPVQALLDPDKGICARYGLSLIRDNYCLYALKNVGSDRGFVVEYGKNMISIDHTENIDSVYTRIIPFGKDKKGNPVYLSGVKWIDSPHINDYAAPRVLLLDCTDTASVQSGVSLSDVRNELRRRAQEMLDNGCDLPELSVKVDFLSLGDTEEYKQYRDLDKVYLYDRITVKDRVRGYNFSAEVVSVRHNVITGRLESLTINSVQAGSSVRKIASWQVPSIDGQNIRLQSITEGVLAPDAVGEDNLQPMCITYAKIANAAIEQLSADAITAVTAKIKQLAAEEITTDELYAGIATIAAAQITAANIDLANIDWANIKTLSAEIAKIANAEIGTAEIDFAQIVDLITGTAIITEGEAGKLFIARLSVTEANMASLTVGSLMIRTESGAFVRLVVDDDGNITTEPVEVEGDNVADNTIPGGKLIEDTITARELNVESIFADKALIGAIKAANIDVGDLFAAQATISALDSYMIRASTIEALEGQLDVWASNKINIAVKERDIERSDTAPENPAENKLWYDTQNNVLKRWTGNEWITLRTNELINNGITIDQSGIDMHVSADANIRANVDGVEKMRLNADGLTAQNVVADKVHANNLIGIFPDATIPWNGGVQASLDACPKYLAQAATLWIPAGNYSENVTVRGFIGEHLTLRLASGTVINGWVQVIDCSHVTIQGAGSDVSCIHPRGAQTAIYACNSALTVSNVCVSGYRGRTTADNGSVYAMDVVSCRIEINNTIMEYAKRGIKCDYGTTGVIWSCKGGRNGSDPATNANLEYGVTVNNGSHIGITGTIPMGGQGATSNWISTIAGSAAATAGGWTYTPPTEVTKTYAVTGIINYNINYAEYPSASSITQGRYLAPYQSGVYKWSIGALWFDGLQELAGKTIKSATVHMRRAAGGWTDARDIHLCAFQVLYDNARNLHNPQNNCTTPFVGAKVRQNTDFSSDISSIMSYLTQGYALATFEPIKSYDSAANWSPDYAVFPAKGEYAPHITVTYEP